MRLFILALALAWAPNVFGQPAAEDVFKLMAESAKPLTQADINTLLTTRSTLRDLQNHMAKFSKEGRKSLSSSQMDLLLTWMKFVTACQELHDRGDLQEEVENIDRAIKKNSGLSEKAVALEKKWLQRMQDYPKAQVRKILSDATLVRIMNHLEGK